MWVASLLMVVLLLRAFRRPRQVPSGLANFFEFIVVFLRDEIVLPIIGEDGNLGDKGPYRQSERMEQGRPVFRVLYQAARRESGGYLREFRHRSGPLLSIPIRRRIAGDSGRAGRDGIPSNCYLFFKYFDT